MTTDQAVEALMRELGYNPNHAHPAVQDVRTAIAAALAAERERALEDAEKALRERSDTHALVGNEVRMSEAFSCSLTVRALKAKEEGK